MYTIYVLSHFRLSKMRIRKILPYIVIVILLFGIFVPASKAFAVDLDEAFPVNKASLAHDSSSDDNYITDNVDISVPDRVMQDTSATVQIRIKVSDGPWQDGKDQTDGTGLKRLDELDSFNSWDSLFGNENIGVNAPQKVGDDGVWLEVTEVDNLVGDWPGQDSYFPEFDTDKMKIIPLNKFVLVPQIINKASTPVITIIVTDLKPNTKYAVRVLLDEDAPGKDQAYSETKEFTTLAKPNNEAVPIQEGVGEDGGVFDSEAALTGALGCTATDVGSWLTGCIIEAVYYIVYVPSTWILEAAGRLFDVFATLSLSTTIYRDTPFVVSGWQIVRDIANIAFIVALIYIGFKTILGLHSGHDKTTLVTVIIIALLVNFSLFISRAVIDSSNIFALIFYNQISITPPASGMEPPITHTDVQEKSLSSGLVNGLGIQKFFGEDAYEKVNAMGEPRATAALLILLGIIVNFTAIWIFFTMALVFIGRIAGLWMSMVFGPFAFVSYILPHGAGISTFGWRAWWHELFSMSFLAPIFIFFVWLILKLIEAMQDGFALAAGNNIGDFTSYMIPILLQFMIIIGLLKEAKTLAVKMSGEIGGQMVKMAESAKGFALGAVGAAATVGVGAAAFAGRKTIGSYAEKKSQDQDLIAKSKEKGFGGFRAKMQLAAADYGAKSSWDLRRSAVGGGLGTMLGKQGISMDSKYLKSFGVTTATGKGGQRAIEEKKAHDYEKEAERLKVNDGNYQNSPEYKKHQQENSLYEETQFKKRQQEEDANGNINYTRVDYDKEKGELRQKDKDKASEYEKKYADEFDTKFSERQKAEMLKGNNSYSRADFEKEFKPEFESKNGKAPQAPPGDAPTKDSINKERLEAFASKLHAGGTDLMAAFKQSKMGEAIAGGVMGATGVGAGAYGLTGTVAGKVIGAAATGLGIAGAVPVAGVAALAAWGHAEGEERARHHAAHHIEESAGKLNKNSENIKQHEDLLSALKQYQKESNQVIEVKDADNKTMTDSQGNPITKARTEALEMRSGDIDSRLDMLKYELRSINENLAGEKDKLRKIDPADAAGKAKIESQINAYQDQQRDALLKKSMYTVEQVKVKSEIKKYQNLPERIANQTDKVANAKERASKSSKKSDHHDDHDDYKAPTVHAPKAEHIPSGGGGGGGHDDHGHGH